MKKNRLTTITTSTLANARYLHHDDDDDDDDDNDDDDDDDDDEYYFYYLLILLKLRFLLHMIPCTEIQSQVQR